MIVHRRPAATIASNGAPSLAARRRPGHLSADAKHARWWSLGALVGWYFDRRAERRANPGEPSSSSASCWPPGLIVGEGLIGVLIAALVAFSGKDFPLSLVGDSFAENGARGLGTITFAVTVGLMYRWVARLRQ